MNGGFEKQGLDEDAFAPKTALSGLKTFDAFPKTKPSYTSATSRGGQWTLALIILSSLLTFSELRRWWSGTESHHFSVERGVGHELQLNLDIVVAMPCDNLHVNVQDAAMDRIMAGDLLTKEDTNWQVWQTRRNPKRRPGGNYQGLHERDKKRKKEEEEDSHVAHVLGHMREGGRKFPKTPRLRGNEEKDSCRIYGSLEGNKVQGDFHITARGHGYSDFGHQQHLEHSTFNFSHQINELSFGPHYPNLLNPLDHTSDVTTANFYKFQYYLSIVPTIFTKRRVSTRDGSLDPAAIPQPPTLDMAPDLNHVPKQSTTDPFGGPEIQHIPNPKSRVDSKSIFTNQYAATSQSREIPPNSIPGIFFKYDIEPVLLIVSEQRNSFLSLVVRLVNVISGVIVGGSWAFQITEWAYEVWGRRRQRAMANGGVLTGNMKHNE